MSDEQQNESLPQPVLRGRRRQDAWLIWLLPVVAALAGLVLVLRAYFNDGPNITITFKTAEGLDANTAVKFKNVVVGTVSKIRLGPDRNSVIVSVDMTDDAEGLVVEDTRFWVERPRVDLSGISGLTTLVSGAYIGMDAGQSSEARTDFEGLEQPPAITQEQKGLRIAMVSETLGSLNIGSPIYYRQLPVGRIVSYELSVDGSSVILNAFINSPYDKFVGTHTRFWNSSGVNVTLDANGLQVQTQSVLSLLAGGLAFEPAPGEKPQAAAPGHRYWIYPSRAAAFALPEGPATVARMRFYQGVRGLNVGAPVEFTGQEIGKVTSIKLDYDDKQQKVFADVRADLFPQRLGPVYQKLQGNGGGDTAAENTLVSLLEHGLSAQLRSSNLVTGALYVALELPAKPERVKVSSKHPLEIPTKVGGTDQLLSQLSEIAEKLNKVPFDEMGQNLNATLHNAEQLLEKLDKEVAPELKKTLGDIRETLAAVRGDLDAADGSMGDNMQDTLEEVNRAAHSLRGLTEYLQRHPEALLRGRADGGPDKPENP